MVECFDLLNCRSLLHSMFFVGVWSNFSIFAGIAAMLAAQLLFTHTALMNRLFHTAPIDAASWLYVTGVGFAAYCVVEFEKMGAPQSRARYLSHDSDRRLRHHTLRRRISRADSGHVARCVRFHPERRYRHAVEERDLAIGRVNTARQTTPCRMKQQEFKLARGRARSHNTPY